MKILVVDDESLARERIIRFLKKFSDLFEIFEAQNGPQALYLISEIKPQIVFLDIQMPEMSGFDIIYQIKEKNFQIIFQTAYDEFAIKAFEVNACDYLLKPFTEEKLHKALKKALNLHEQSEKLQNLESNLKKQCNYLKTILVKKNNEYSILKVIDILYFKSEDHYTFAYTDKKEFIIDLSLNQLEDKLNVDEFFRIHRNSLVRIAEIESLSSAEESSLKLKNGVALDISRNSRKSLLKRLQK